MSDYEVVWSGATKLSLTSGDGWTLRESYLTQASDVLSPATGRNGTRAPQTTRTHCACGRKMTLVPHSRYTQCAECRGVKTWRRRCACGLPLTVGQVNARRRTCDPCLKLGRTAA